MVGVRFPGQVRIALYTAVLFCKASSVWLYVYYHAKALTLRISACAHGARRDVARHDARPLMLTVTSSAGDARGRLPSSPPRIWALANTGATGFGVLSDRLKYSAIFPVCFRSWCVGWKLFGLPGLA